ARPSLPRAGAASASSGSTPGSAHESPDALAILVSVLAFDAARHVDTGWPGLGDGAGHVLGGEAAGDEQLPAMQGAGPGSERPGEAPARPRRGAVEKDARRSRAGLERILRRHLEGGVQRETGGPGRPRAV